jgi:hypothetical protein
MNSRTQPIRAPWKLAGLLLLIVAIPSAPVFAQNQPADPDALRQQAISQYIDGATKELDAYRSQIDAAARPDNQRQMREAKAKLDESSKLLTELKSADSSRFDVVKASYEHSREDLTKAVQAEQKT